MVNEHTRVRFSGIFEKYKAVEYRLPWNRLFEIELKTEEKQNET
jgi:hypothetical protein